MIGRVGVDDVGIARTLLLIRVLLLLTPVVEDERGHGDQDDEDNAHDDVPRHGNAPLLIATLAAFLLARSVIVVLVVIILVGSPLPARAVIVFVLDRGLHSRGLPGGSLCRGGLILDHLELHGLGVGDDDRRLALR